MRTVTTTDNWLPANTVLLSGCLLLLATNYPCQWSKSELSSGGKLVNLFVATARKLTKSSDHWTLAPLLEIVIVNFLSLEFVMNCRRQEGNH